MKNEDVVVVHPIQQHSQMTSKVLYDHHRLNTLYTTMYFNENSILFKMLNIFIPKKYKYKLKNKKNLSYDHKVKSYYTFFGLFYIFLGKTRISKKLLNIYKDWLTKIFSKKVSKDMIKNKKIRYVISYDTYSRDLFKYLEGFKIKKILDMSSIPIKKINQIIDSEIAKKYEFNKDLVITKKSFSKNMIKNSLEEINNADAFLVGSKFTKRSLIEIDKTTKNKPIIIAPYFVEKFFFQNKELIKKSKIRFLYVGRLTAVKGFHYLLETIKILDEKIEFIIIGHAQNSKKYIKQLPSNVKYLGVIKKTEMYKEYLSSDVLVFPSLFDGYGKSIIEAMASSLAIIATKNSGASDHIIDGESGFKIDAGSIKLLLEKINWFINNPSEIKTMGKKGQKIVSNITEKSYYKQISEIL